MREVLEKGLEALAQFSGITWTFGNNREVEQPSTSWLVRVYCKASGVKQNRLLLECDLRRALVCEPPWLITRSTVGNQSMLALIASVPDPPGPQIRPLR